MLMMLGSGGIKKATQGPCQVAEVGKSTLLWHVSDSALAYLSREHISGQDASCLHRLQLDR